MKLLSSGIQLAKTKSKELSEKRIRLSLRHSENTSRKITNAQLVITFNEKHMHIHTMV